MALAGFFVFMTSMLVCLAAMRVNRRSENCHDARDDDGYCFHCKFTRIMPTITAAANSNAHFSAPDLAIGRAVCAA